MKVVYISLFEKYDLEDLLARAKPNQYFNNGPGDFFSNLNCKGCQIILCCLAEGKNINIHCFRNI